jgi:hypothetical protein
MDDEDKNKLSENNQRNFERENNRATSTCQRLIKNWMKVKIIIKKNAT